MPGELELASVLPLAGVGHEVILVRRVAHHRIVLALVREVR